MNSTDFTLYLRRIVAGEKLSATEARTVFDAVMAGEIAEIQIAALITALAMRGPSVEEVTGATSALRAAMTTLHAPADAIDLVGTGGDGHCTLNVSSAASFVVAACGVPVAKHGNRNMTSKSGAADVLEALGVKIALSPQAAEFCLEQAGITFLFAQSFHSAMRHVTGVRRALGFRSIFNLMGPMSNPAGVKRQLLGVYAREWLRPVAETLGALGTEKAMVVCGRDGMDEITVTGPTDAALLEGGSVRLLTLSPADVDLPISPLAELKGGVAAENAVALTRLLDGAPGAYRNIVLMNAAAALIVADKAKTMTEGVELATAAIDAGAAKRVLEKLIAASNAQ
jgi:anthranilate phosphoribosyltransferase